MIGLLLNKLIVRAHNLLLSEELPFYIFYTNTIKIVFFLQVKVIITAVSSRLSVPAEISNCVAFLAKATYSSQYLSTPFRSVNEYLPSFKDGLLILDRKASDSFHTRDSDE